MVGWVCTLLNSLKTYVDDFHAAEEECRRLSVRTHKRPFVGVSQGTLLGFGDGFGAILWDTVAES